MACDVSPVAVFFPNMQFVCSGLTSTPTVVGYTPKSPVLNCPFYTHWYSLWTVVQPVSRWRGRCESKEKANHLKISAWAWALLNRQLPEAVEDFRDECCGPRAIFDYNVLSCTAHVCSSFSEDEILSSRKASFDDPIVSAPATIRSSKGLSKSCYKILDQNYTTVEMGLRTTMRWGWSEYWTQHVL